MEMPWIIDKNGDKRYKASIYAKEELPTWNEIYDWFKNNIGYNPKDETHQDLDPYWGIPYRKYLQAIICNQFNKMLFEDGMEKELVIFIKDKYYSDKNDFIRPKRVEFIIDEFDVDLYNKLTSVNPDDRGIPTIYTIPLPTGEKNPFILTDHPRVDINIFNEFLIPTPLIFLEGEMITKDKKLHGLCNIVPNSKNPNTDQSKMYKDIISFILKEVSLYFSEPIGWKDKNGNPIEVDITPDHQCVGDGFDPAL